MVCRTFLWGVPVDLMKYKALRSKKMNKKGSAIIPCRRVVKAACEKLPNHVNDRRVV